MARIAADITWLIGSTPLVELHRLAPTGARLVAKLESFNPSGSNKDRTALGMIQHAELHGSLKPAGTIIECTSGDLGLAIAMVGRRRGYRVILTMPENATVLRPTLLRALGAELVLTKAADGMRGAMAHAEELVRKTEGAICLQAFSNRANAKIHGETTAHEIWQDTDGAVRAIVVPIGTGGTAAGCAAVLRERGVRIIGVEPSTSAVLSGQNAGSHDIPGLGAGFIPGLLGHKVLDEVVRVTDVEANVSVQDLARTESILVGPASGAVLHAARHVAQRPEYQGQLIIAVLPDSGERFCDHRAYRQEE
ncbi:cysteine synthase [Planctomycetota bacterium]|nr:cysteine synthase family protein [Planctomycetota bacterium]MSR38478.1 cysteine synthase family protein [Planctomycetota bacterium]GDY01405.1 cysteine synthase [Planctomycetota bacterium]